MDSGDRLLHHGGGIGGEEGKRKKRGRKEGMRGEERKGKEVKVMVGREKRK